MKLVLIEDNFAIRFLLKSYLAEEFTEIDIFTAADGISGLGLIYAVNPDAVIIDATLPKYSGREVVEYVVTNQRLNNHKVIIITDGSHKFEKALPLNFVIVEKNDIEFLNKISALLGGRNEEGNFISKLKKRFRKDLLNFSNKEDIIRLEMSNRFLSKIILFFPWLISEIINSLHLAALLLLTQNGKDANISQEKEDLEKFRVKVYPTLIAVLAGAFLMLCQLTLFITGGIIIFNSVQIESIFADYTREVQINLSNSDYDSALIEFKDGSIKLKEQFVDVTVIEEETTGIEDTEILPTVGDTLVEPITGDTPPISGNVEGESIEKVSIGYSTSVPYIIFNDPVSFSSLLGFAESVSPAGEINDKNLNGVTYQFSPNKTEWYYFSNENIWEKTSGSWASSNSADVVNENILSLEQAIGGNLLYIKAFLHSDGTVSTQINSLTVSRELQIVYSVEEPILTDLSNNLVPEVFEIEDLTEIPVSAPVSGAIEFIKELPKKNIALPSPVIYQASFANGNKVVYGKTTKTVPLDLLENFIVKIYYSDGTLIGETKLENNLRGETTFLLRTPSTAGGFVFAEIEFKSVSGEVLKSPKSDIIENSTFTVDSTGDEIDDTPGDGLCSTVSVTCTLNAAIAEANALAGSDNIYFNIPTTDSGFRDYDDPATPSSGDSLGGDDYWTIQTAGLPTITEGVIIDASTQTVNGGDLNVDGPEIEVLTSTAGVSIFVLNGANNTEIKGFALNDSHSAVWIPNGANISGVSILENYLALDVKGIAFKYFEDNSTSARPGCITYEGGAAVTIDNLLIQDNIIGQPFCLRFDSTIETTVTSSSILGNYFGLNRAGQAGTGFGAYPTTTFNNINNLVIGDGTEQGRNIFAGNATDLNSRYLDIAADVSVIDLSIKGNYFGLDPTGMFERTNNIQVSVGIDTPVATNVNIGGTAIADRNVIGGVSCSSCGSYAVAVSNSSGVDLNFANVSFENNTIGLLSDGVTSTVQIAQRGLSLSGPLGNMTIKNNYFAGGVRWGIIIEGSSSNFSVLGNVFGLNTLLETLPSVTVDAGIIFTDTVVAVSDITIGDGTVSGRNTFGGVVNAITYHGNNSASLNQLSIKGNYFGTDGTGIVARPISESGIFLECGGSCTDIFIGGIIAGEENVISSGKRGIHVRNLAGPPAVLNNIQIIGNIIGSSKDGIQNLGHQRSGIVVQTSGVGVTTPVNFNISNNLIRFNNIEETFDIFGYSSTFGGIQILGGINTSGLVIENNDLSDNRGDGIILTNHAGYGIDTGSALGWPIIRNNIIGAGTGRVISGLELGGNLKNGIGTFIAAMQIYGNEIKENGRYGVVSFSVSYDQNAIPFGFTPSKLFIGGSTVLAGSLCNGLKENCISQNEWGGIFSVDSTPENELTLYTDNDFGAGNGTLDKENIIQTWSGFFELFSGIQRRTDIADGYLNLTIPLSNIFQFSLNPSSRQLTVGNSTQDCATPIYCPTLGTTNGIENKSNVFAGNPPLFDAYGWPLMRGNFVEYIIDNAGLKTTYSDYKIDQNHLAQLSLFTTDGDSTTQPQSSADRGHVWSINTTGDRDYISNSFGAGTAIELEMVDANPIWNGSEWLITVDTTTGEDNVSLAGFNDGAGQYSGGGINGPDGIANGKTSLREAMFVANTFPGDVRIVFDPITNPDGSYPIGHLAPANGSVFENRRPTLSWTVSPDPWIGSYDIYINGSYKTSVLAPATSYTFTEDLSGSYSWFIVSKRTNNVASATTSAWTFTVDVPVPVYPITLTSPQNNVTLNALPILQWQSSTDPAIFAYRIFLNGKLVKEVSSNILEYASTNLDINSGDNNWQIIGIRSDGTQSGVSEIRIFSIIMPAIITVIDTPIVVDQISLDIPLNNTAEIIDTAVSVSPVLIAATVSVFTGFALSGGGHQLLKSLMILGLLIPRKRKYWGLVVDLEANKPVPFATVTIAGLEDIKDTLQAITDTEGKYYIRTPNNGKYRMLVSANGYISFETDVNILNNELVADVAINRSENTTLIGRIRKAIYYFKPEIIDILRLSLAVIVLFGFGYTVSTVITSSTLINILFLILYSIIILINLPTLISMFRLKEGRILNVKTNRGVSGVIARLYSKNFNVVDVKISNNEGFIRFNSGNGAHFINCWKHGFELDRLNNKVLETGLLKLVEVKITEKGISSNVYLAESSNEPLNSKFELNNGD